MNTERQITAMRVILVGAGITSIYMIGKSVTSSLKRLRTINAALAIENKIKSVISNPLPSSVIVSSASQWEAFYEQFSR